MLHLFVDLLMFCLLSLPRFALLLTKKKKKKKQAGGKNAPAGRSTIVHAIDTMESFSMLSIAPPSNKVRVDSSVGR